MKKIFLTLTTLVVSFMAIAQSPNLFNYQGVARNAVGNVLPNQPIGLRLSILTGSPTGAAVYTETRNVPTNAFGLFNVQVGSPGAITSTGTIAGINWTAFGTGSGTKYLKVEIDPIGGTNYVNAGTTQLVSVPYALNAAGAAPIGPAGGDLTGTYPNPQILIPLIKTQAVPANPLVGMTNSSTTGTIGAIQGISASTDGGANGIWGMISSTTPGSFSTGLRGTNNGTGGLGIGVTGTQNGSGWGVYGTTPSGIGVHGASTSGFGLYGLSSSGVGTYGTSSTGSAGMFENTNTANTSVALAANSNGTNHTVSGVNTGTGRAAYFQVNNIASTADALRAETNGVGASWAIRGISTGTNGAGLFQQTNATNTSNNLQSTQAGLGRAGLFNATNVASTANAVEVNVAGAGAGLVSTTTGTGSSAIFNNTNAANGSISVLADNANVGNVAYGNNTIYGRRGATSANTFLYTGVPTGVTGSSSAGIGLQGTSESFFGVAGLSYDGAGVQAVTLNTGTALYAQAFGTGITANFVNTNPANLNNTLRIDNANLSNTAYGNNTVYARRGATSGNTFLYTGVPTGITGSSSTGIGVQGTSESFFGVAGLTFNGTGVQAVSVNTGSALVAQAFGTGYAIQSVGRVQISGQGAAAGRVLTSDALGNATWQAPSAAATKVSFRGGIGGSYTVPNGGFVDLICNTIAFEEGGSNYNTGTGVYTVPVTGLYAISVKYAWNTFASNTGQQNTIIYVNGGFAELGANATSNTSQFIKGAAQATLMLTAGEQVKVGVYQNSGANATIPAFGITDNNFSIYLIH